MNEIELIIDVAWQECRQLLQIGESPFNYTLFVSPYLSLIIPNGSRIRGFRLDIDNDLSALEYRFEKTEEVEAKRFLDRLVRELDTGQLPLISVNLPTAQWKEIVIKDFEKGTFELILQAFKLQLANKRFFRMREHKEPFSYVSSGASISLRVRQIEYFLENRYIIDFMVV
jgi:hypothetical protein